MEKLKEKKKKHKKHKKLKKAKKSHAGYNSSSDSDSEPEWVESVSKPSPVQSSSSLARDDWMQEVDSFGPTFSKNEMKERTSQSQDKTKDKEKADLAKLGQHERELNPYWQHGGDGLPSESSEKSEESEKTKSRSSVGDGGLNWLRKAYKRVMEQAEEEGRSPEDVAAERWGSLDKLKSLLQAAEEQHDTKQRTTYSKDDPPSHRFYSSQQRRFKSGGQRHHSKREKRDYNDYSSSNRNSERGYSRSPSPKYSDRYRRRHSRSPPSKDSSRYKKDYSEEIVETSDKKEESEKKPKVDSQNNLPQKMENLFVRPAVDDSEEFNNSNKKLDIKTSNSSFNYARTPSWRKKEFVQKNNESNSMSPSVTETSDCLKCDKPPTSSFDSPEQSPEPSVLSDQEMNELGAKILKAEIMGNNELAKKLKDRLEMARKAKEEGGLSTGKSETKRPASQEEVVILTKTDNKGMTRPLVLSDEIEPSTSRRKKQKVATHETGARVRYFPDDDRYSLKQLFEKEKLTTAEDQNAVFAALAGKSLPRLNADFDIDDAFISEANTKQSQAKLDARERLQAIGEYKKKAATLEKCNHCFGNSNLPKHLIISIGKKVYLRLPSYTSLNEGHCFVVPRIHTVAGTYLDEDVLEEIEIYKKALTAMFEKQGQDVVFFETSMNLKYFPHMTLECVPLARDVGDMAAIYFKKAILESESEWANNKKLVDYKKKPIGRVVPKGLPYFCVEFGLDGGFAHVIEDERSFPKYFAQEILGGMMDLEPRLWRNPPKQKFEDQRVKVLKFAEWWKPYEELIQN